MVCSKKATAARCRVVVILLTSTTVSAPVMAAARPVPVVRSTPADRAMGTTGQPRVRSAVTSGAPTAPVAPATTTVPRRLGAAEGWWSDRPTAERVALASAYSQACVGAGQRHIGRFTRLACSRLHSTCRESANTGSHYQHVVHIVTMERSQ